MADDVTQVSEMIDPQVLADMISAELPKAVKFSTLSPMDTTLQGRPGDTVTVPRWKYIGDAKDVEEGAAIDYSKLTSSTDTFTIKKVGTGVKLTDESVLVGYGDPIGQAQKQITMAMASKIDNDIVATASKARLSLGSVDFTKLDFIDQIEDAFIDDTSEQNVETDDTAKGVIFINPKDANTVRKAAALNWERQTDLGDSMLTSGVFGGVLGWQFQRSRKIPVGSAIVAKPGAMKTYLKRNVNSETGRDMDHKLTKFNADAIYGVAIYDDTKLLVIKPFNYADGTYIEQNTKNVPDDSTKSANKRKSSTQAPAQAPVTGDNTGK
ncbi:MULTISPECIES: N4-gp56 family major capsid protein [Convivina]|uniref:N4-gp56 family major capsid protein n=2 Tax=Convivina TaxID=1697027 RepID=A0A2U1DFR5_9LACO|nr:MULTISPECIES: N4-gp56 family major capsid protein [Convivina]SDC13196.1 major capsid protein, N4-gp56 family [Leuconostocaceae bacterium R-53105]PVY86515.1 N4-gp56 family major capsid protein [Convivina intestini]CAH1853309.1 hypothetical protein R077815_00793 [Convivina sp. LMG 32447]CAH1854676.1 hypothetical protein LMG032447_00907 [Convivina sp. LMG 32447]CAH1857477.1 hypothetical protein R077811_01525 [Convivina intestini]